jgi:hypothetical protein
LATASFLASLVGFVHKGVELLSAFAVVTAPDTGNSFRREDHLVTRHAGFLLTADTSGDRITNAVPIATNRMTAHSSKTLDASIAATVAHF